MDRIQANMREYQKKIEDERKVNLLSKQKLSFLEQEEQKLKIENENLAKKIDFFKIQAAKGKFDAHDTKTRKDPDVQAHQFAKEVDVSDRSSSKENLKLRIKKIKEKIDQIKLAYREQLILVKQENLLFKQSIQSLFEILTLRLGEESKKSSFL